MTPIDYGTARMRVDDRLRAAENRRMIRHARLEAKAQRPQHAFLSKALRGSSHTLSRLATWKHPASSARQARTVAQS